MENECSPMEVPYRTDGRTHGETMSTTKWRKGLSALSAEQTGQKCRNGSSTHSIARPHILGGRKDMENDPVKPKCRHQQSGWRPYWQYDRADCGKIAHWRFKPNGLTYCTRHAKQRGLSLCERLVFEDIKNK